MTSGYFLAASVRSPVPPPPRLREPLPELTLASMDDTRRIELNVRSRWVRMPGSTGLEMAPVNVITEGSPGVYGSVLREVLVMERPIFIPVYCWSDTFVSRQEMQDELRRIIDPLSGEFRIIGQSARGARELVAVYQEGLEGADGRDTEGLHWRKMGIKAVACSPFARKQRPHTLEFKVSSVNRPFISAAGTDHPWPRAIVSSAVIGSGMKITIDSEIPPYPDLELVGPMTSFTGTLEDVPDPGSVYGLDATWSLSIPGGIPSGQTFRLVTDPRARSARIGAGDPATNPAWTGSLAAGRIALGSTLRPFPRGLSTLDVVAPGATADTRVRLRWHDLYWSLW